MGKTKNNSSRRPLKWAALATYAVMVVCLLLGLLLPLGADGIKLEYMLAYQLPKAVEAAALHAFQIPFGAEFTYSMPVNFFGMFEYDLGALLVVLYALATVAALIGLIPVIASNKKSPTAVKTAGLIECLALIPLLTLVLMQMYAYAVTATFSYTLLIAFGGTLLMLIVQAFAYKKGSGLIKFILFLLSAVAVLVTMFNVSTFIPALKELLGGVFANGLYGGAIEGAAWIEALCTGNFAAILGGEGAAVTVMILNIASLAAAILVFVNLYLDVMGLGKKTRKFMLITNLVRYSLEVLAVLLVFILTFFVDGANTLGILLIALLAIAIVQLVINIIRTVTFGKHKKKAPAKKSEAKEGETEEGKEGEAGEKKLSKKEQKRLAKEEVKAAKEKEAEEKKAAKEKEAEEKKAAKEEKKAAEKPMEVHEAPGYLVYNGPTDHFINKLNNAEKQEFFNVFLERNVISLPNIPQYVPGGKNEKFFSAVFIYFGKVRDYVSDGLLNKLYEQINMM